MVVVATIAAVYVGLCLLMYLFQARLVYFPMRGIEDTPGARGLPFEAVPLRASDGTKLGAWLIPADAPRGVVLVCHGNAGNISHRLDLAIFFRKLGLSTLLFDYRGYGESEGNPTERGTYLDAEAAWGFLVNERKVPPGQIVVFGESLGGAVAAWLAKDRQPGALVLQSTFTSLPDLGARLYPWLPVRLLSRFRYNTREYVRQAKCPILVMHSRSDEIVPFSHGTKLFEAANEPKEFIELAGSHNDGFLLSGQASLESLATFLAKHLSR